MKKYYLFFLIFISTVSAESFKELQEIPKDSINAESMKIWIPVESNICQVIVKILDKDNNLVRKLLDRRVRQGYYNIYWDKKDDSGNYVDTGSYNVAVISCNYRKINQIMVSYQKGENAVLFKLLAEEQPPALRLRLLADSLHVHVAVYNKRELLVEELLQDSLVTKMRTPEIFWKPKLNIPSGDYMYMVKVDRFAHYVKFTYKRKAVKK